MDPLPCIWPQNLLPKEQARTSQQNISRLGSPSYGGHYLSMLRSVAEALGATVRVTFEASTATATDVLSESSTPYKTRKAH